MYFAATGNMIIKVEDTATMQNILNGDGTDSVFEMTSNGTIVSTQQQQQQSNNVANGGSITISSNTSNTSSMLCSTPSMEPKFISITVTTPNFPEKLEKVFEFSNIDPIWNAKQKVLIEFASSKYLVDPLNFGFYMPPYAGRAGKFLNEERTFRDYPMDRSSRILEFRYKRRIFRHLNRDNDKKLQKVNTKKNRKKFMERIYMRNIPGIEKLLVKGLDPNYHDEKSGETPLTITAMLDDNIGILKLLVQYGAYLDFRSSSNGYTALHTVAANGKEDSLKNLLDLGASPNSKDSEGLTPLYRSIQKGSNSVISELLLKDRCLLGVTDLQGLEEIHQACRLDHVQHVEHLIFYGADINARTASGNTPLHICALENRESCARVLLFRGADRSLANYAKQTPYDISILSNHLDVALLLNDFDDSNVTPFMHKPELTIRKRVATLSDTRSPSISITSSTKDSSSTSSDPPSPTPIGKSLKAVSTPADMHALTLLKRRKASTGSLPETVEEHSESESESEDEESKSKTLDIRQKRIFSNGGIGTQRSPAPMKISPRNQHLRTRLYASVPGRNFVAIKNYEPKNTGELTLKKGDIVDVLFVGEGGFWEGTVKGRAGWFPSSYVQEVKKGDSLRGKSRSWLGGGRKRSLDIPENLSAKTEQPKPRNIVLNRSELGFGFQLRGANSHLAHLDFNPTPQFPALQYIGDVDKGGVAEKAGVCAGDFVLEINSESVVNATHGHAVSLINKGGSPLSMKLITVAPESGMQMENAILTQVNAKANPPPPPIRASSTVLSTREDSVLAEGSIPPNASETVILEKSKDNSACMKGMWSGNAYRLQGDDSSVKEEDISSGIGKKPGHLNNDLAAKFDERLKTLTQPVTIDKSAYPSVQNYSRSQSDASGLHSGVHYKHIRSTSTLSASSNNSADSDVPKRKPTPPGYDHTMDNMRRGRTNSLGRGDNARPMHMQRSMTQDLEKRYNDEYRNELSRNHRHTNRHSMYDDSMYNTYDPRRNNLLDRQQYEAQFSSARRYNRNDPLTMGNHPAVQYREQRMNDPRMTKRPQSEFYARDHMDNRQFRSNIPDQSRYPNDVSKKQETVLEKHRKYIGEQNFRSVQEIPSNQFYNTPPSTQQQHSPIDQYMPPPQLQYSRNMQQGDGLIRNQDQRKKSANQPSPPPPPPPVQNIPPQPQQFNAMPATTHPPPPPPPPPPPSDENKESQSALSNSLANAVAARSMRVKNENIDETIARNKNKCEIDTDSLGPNGNESTRLYNSSSSISLDSSSSKDSGFDNTDSLDHSSALAQAIAARAAKLNKEQSSSTISKPLEVTKEVPEVETSTIEETNLMKPSAMLKLRKTSTNNNINNNKVSKDLNSNEIDNGYSSPTSRPRCKSDIPPPVSKKPKARSSSDKKCLSEDTATAFLDGVLKDAENSIDYDLISSSSSEDNNNNNSIPLKKQPLRKIGSLTIISGADKQVICGNKPVIEDDLPPPPMDMLNEINAETTEAIDKRLVNRSDSLSSNNSTRSNLSLPSALMDKPFMDWTSSDVCDWLEHLSLGQYKNTFLENDIEGKHLPDLSKDELKELGISKLGHRMTLDDSISKLKSLAI